MRKFLLYDSTRSLKLFFTVVLLSVLSVNNLNAQCLNVSPFGTGNLTAATGSTATIGCNYAEEYGTWNGIVAGLTYTTTSTVGTDFITVRSGTPGGPVVASGTQPLTWIPAVGGVHYIHINTDAACGTAASCRNVTTTNLGLPAPSAPVQDVALPSCATGTGLTVASTPAANNAYYWQTSATGTSFATPYAGTYTVFANGTYFIRTYSTVSLSWSNAVSVTVSNFPLATPPPAPIAALDPSCVTTGSTLSIATAPAGTVYYWQGTTMNGISNALNATTPFAYTASGTYYVAAFETASQCWSVTTPVTVTVDTYIPAAPSAAVDNFNICAGATSLEISATAPGGSASTNGSNATSIAIPDNNTTGISSTINISNIPAGATITGISVGLNITHTWNSDVDIFLTGSNGTQIELSTDNGGSADNYTNTIFSSAGVNPITGGISPFTGTFLPEGNLATLYSLTNGSWILTVKDDLGGDLGTLLNWDISITYTLPASIISWYDAASAGNSVGTGSPLETVGSSVLSNPASFGTYQFYAGAVSGACVSTSRTLVTVNVANTNAVLTPVNTSCNGANDGTFTLGTIECGTLPFLYSLDGGTTFGAIPTNLVAGTYAVIIQDVNGFESSPITVVVGQPAPPSALTLVDANYFTADVSWTTTGNETSWNVEYGPTGFTPGTGTILNTTTTFATLTGLTANTAYQFYVTPVCGANPAAGGPAAFSTGAGFFTYDNACGPGYMDISGTGLGTDLNDDNSVGFTLPWTLDYQGTSVTDMSISNNGGILFNTLSTTLFFVNGSIATAAIGLYPYWDDLLGQGTNNTVYTEVIGTAPNRQAIIEWNVSTYGAPTSDYAFQVVIEEATDEIYYIYDNVDVGDVTRSYGATATIGAAGTNDVQVSFDNTAYLTNNSCVRFYNALCPNAVISTVTPAAEEVTLDWNAGLYNETEWTLIYGLAGFDPLTGGTTITVTTSDANIPGLTQLTDYDVYIYSECTIDNLTSGGLLVSFTTLPWCANPIALGGTTDVDSLFATWNFVPAGGAPQALSSFNLQYGPFGFDLYAGTDEVATGLDYADTVTNAAWLAGGVYQLYVQAVCGTDTSSYSGPFTFVMPLTNDSVCGAEMLQVDGTVYTFNNTGATAAVGEAAIVPQGTYPDGYNVTNLPTLTWGSAFADGSNWYTFVAPASGSMWFSGQDENFFASQIAIYELTDCADFSTFSLVAASDQMNDFGNEDQFDDIKVAPHFTVCGLTPGATYYVMHDAWGNGFDPAIFGQYSIKMTEIVLEAGSFTDVINTCTGSTVDLFNGITGNDAGGIWTAEIPAAGTGITDSLWNSTGLAYQLFNFEYRVTEGCAYDSIVAQVDVYEPSTAGEDGTISVCRNEPYDLLSGLNGTADLGGTWYNPSNLPLANSAVVASNIPGQYNFVYIAGNGVCPDDSALVLVNVDATCNYLNVDEMFFATMTVMPNPSNGVFNVANTGSTEVFNFEVTDMEGRIVLAKDAAINGSTTTEINLTGKVTGMYMIRVYNDNAEKTFRVILQ
jgi:subtilisin-like proprotein convertase family protein